jgi:endoglucanase
MRRARRLPLLCAMAMGAGLLTPWARAGASPLGEGSYLHTEGALLRDRGGRAVSLRGVNVGGWLVTEGWMCGQSDDGGRWALEQLEARFGPERAARLMGAWYGNWLTAGDLDRIASYGFNLVRVPFGYRNLQAASGAWQRDGTGAIDFSRMDWIVREAGARGIYVVLDLHVWPGQRENYQLISRLEPGGDEARARAAAIWSEVARHYAGDGAVAAFDLANEPEGSPGDALQRALGEAVRAQDPERVVIVESSDYANLRDPYWSNTVWSGHYPVDDGPGTVEERVARWGAERGLAGDAGVAAPVLIGEMKAPEDTAESAFALAEAMNRRGWSWAVWTYKGANVGGWASLNYDSSFRYDLARDSYESLLGRWGRELTQWLDPQAPPNTYVSGWWAEGFGRGAMAR